MCVWVCVCVCVRPWCNGYRRRKWTRRQEFKPWTRLIAFHIALIPLGKVWIQLFSYGGRIFGMLWVNSRADLVRQLVQEKENSEFKPVKLRLKIDLVSYPGRAEGLGKYVYVCVSISCLYLYSKRYRHDHVFLRKEIPDEQGILKLCH